MKLDTTQIRTMADLVIAGRTRRICLDLCDRVDELEAALHKAAEDIALIGSHMPRVPQFDVARDDVEAALARISECNAGSRLVARAATLEAALRKISTAQYAPHESHVSVARAALEGK